MSNNQYLVGVQIDEINMKIVFLEDIREFEHWCDTIKFNSAIKYFKEQISVKKYGGKSLYANFTFDQKTTFAIMNNEQQQPRTVYKKEDNVSLEAINISEAK